ncbi:MAG TPA: lysophospholipid acyltransferase family protein [Bryobacteraceae bacterium]|nr:lysophospholipid acyltransferase family protein [Bryobacteraceae bacterium]
MHRLRAYLFADPAIILSTLFFGTLSIIASLFDRSGNAPIRVARAWARSLLSIGGVRVHVEGLDRLSPEGSYVFIANHLSYMDTPVVLGNIPVQFRFLAKKGLFQIPFLGTHLSQAGHIPVPREDPRASVRTMQLAAETIQSRKISLLIFPEGGRSHDGIMRPFKEGAAYIAIRAGVPAVPVALIGTRRILPFGSGVIVPGPVTLRILPPIDTRELTLKDRGRVTEEVRALIANELDHASAGQLAQKSSF